MLKVIAVTTYIPLMAGVALAGIGLFVLSRNRKAAVNRLFAGGTLALVVADVAWFGFVNSSGASLLVWWQRVVVAAHILMLPIWYLFSVSLGSAGSWTRLHRQRHLAWGIGGVSLIFLALNPTGSVIQGAQVHYDGSITFPLGWAGKAVMLGSLAIAMIILANLEMTFRHADRQTRRKIKFLVLGLFGILGFHIYWLSRTILYSAVITDPFVAQAVTHMIAGGLMVFSLVRHRLLDVDVFVSRYVVCRSLTVLLVGAYLLLLGIGREAVRVLGVEFGEWASAALLIVGGLALAALLLAEGFQRRVKVFIDTHFYKNKYDYRKEWLSLTERLAEAVTVDEVAPRIVEGLIQTMWVERAGIYLLDGGKTHLRLAFGVGFEPDGQVLCVQRDFLRIATEHAQPIDVETARSNPGGKCSETLIEALWRIGVRIAVPMVVRDEILGLLVVGSDLSGQPFRPDDYDLCRTVAAQAATVIMNARLAEDHAHSREIRAFAEMASFMIHDIKNCINTLSLVASNAEAHIHRPTFQQDLVHAIRHSVEKMQGVLTRFSGVRGPKLCRKQINLNEVVREALRSLNVGMSGAVRIESLMGLSTPLIADPDHLEGVIRNLAMNALEALEGGGKICIETFQEGDEAVLVVSDNGRGMSSEFMHHSLFRPFRSTKGSLGIGMYQCKQVAEVHGGKLEVQSVEGQGTTCILRLPLDGQGELAGVGDSGISYGQVRK